MAGPGSQHPGGEGNIGTAQHGRGLASVSMYTGSVACSGQVAGKADLPTVQDICWWPGVSCLGTQEGPEGSEVTLALSLRGTERSPPS